MSEKPQVGDKVVVTTISEGKVIAHTGDAIVYRNEETGCIQVSYESEADISFERAKPKPKWQDGDVIHNRATSSTVVRSKGNWYSETGELFWYYDPSHDNRWLVPVIQGGKLVARKAL